MDKPSTSRQVNQPRLVRSVNVRENDFALRVNRMIHDVSYVSSDESDVVDDSDADPDYVLPEENPHDDECSSEEPDDQRRQPIAPDEMMLTANDEVGDDDDPLLDELPQGDVQNPTLPEYIFSRLRKNEFGPPYWWTTTEPTTNVRTPARNIV